MKPDNPILSAYTVAPIPITHIIIGIVMWFFVLQIGWKLAKDWYAYEIGDFYEEAHKPRTSPSLIITAAWVMLLIIASVWTYIAFW